LACDKDIVEQPSNGVEFFQCALFNFSFAPMEAQGRFAFSIREASTVKNKWIVL